MIRSLSFFLFLIFTPFTYGQLEIGRFVATEASYKFSNPHEPRQRYILEIEDRTETTGFRLIKAVYFIPTNGRRGGAIEIEKEKISYRNQWKFELVFPQNEEEKQLCIGIENYSKNEKGKIILNKQDREPVPMFTSTLYAADIIFEDLSEMPCFVLKKLQS
jgi:hypothetical protein